MVKLQGTAPNQVPTNADLGSLAYADHDNVNLTAADLKLKALSKTKNQTAVDVFIYDTSKDSDGGAWRHRTQHTSWYNEGASSTRGSRKEFPAVVVIVAEADKVTIYDGDDPSLPMWMVFNQTSGSVSTGNMVYGEPLLIVTSLGILNGHLCVGSDAYCSEINFLTDFALFRGSTNGPWEYNGTISERNGALGWTENADASGRIVDRAVNDVAMTVLPDAPTDPATGLPVPTIAVATDGGTSVIKDDGTVYDLTGNGHSSVDIGTDGVAYTTRITPASNVIYGWELPTADTSTQDYYYAPNQVPPIGVAVSGGFPDNITRTGRAGETTFSYGYKTHLGNVSEDRATVSNGMFNQTTSSYTTGWMPGDIKLAALADTDDTDLNPAEEVVDSTFDNAASWTTTSGVSIAGGEAVWNAAVTDDYVLQNSVFTTGLQYKITVTVSSYTSGDLRGRFGGAVTDTLFGITGTGTYTVIGSATGAPLLLTASGSTTLSLSDVSVKLLDQDRSVNGKGLAVHGSITKAPVATGADVVAYSGFSTSNYLEQPYNDDLDFGAYTGTAGTGDFSVMAWVKMTNSFQTLASRFDSNGFSGNGWYIDRNGSDELRFNNYISGSNTVISAGTIPSNVWSCLAVLRRNGVLYFYIDGNEVGNQAFTDTISHTNSVLYVGVRNNAGSISNVIPNVALLRISATAPTADQIRKIYEDEKVLFQDSAKATLTGSSDAVTALAHDPDTNLLHVGTSGGRSVFQGLRRVEEHTGTDNQSLAAISAVDGLVVEGK